MIYYSEKPLKTWQPNLIMLDLEDDLGHVYVTRNTYDQAVVISDRFNHDPDLVLNKLGCEVTQEDVTSYMIAILPSPIRILVPFYNLIDDSVVIDVENTKQVVGILSYISTMISFNAILKVPAEVRANLVFTKSILLEYQSHFDDFNFQITSDRRHIIHEEVAASIVEESNIVFGEVLEDGDTVISEPLNLDNFMESLGWDDIEVPSLKVEDNTTKESTTISAGQSNETSLNITKDPAAEYLEIAARFATPK